MNWIVSSIAIFGTFLVTSKRSRIRLWAFILWTVTNTYWMIYAGDPALQAQFAIYLILSFVGIRNNWEGFSR